MAEVEIQVSGIKGVIPDFDEDLEMLKGDLVETCLEANKPYLTTSQIAVNFTDASGGQGREIGINVVMNLSFEIKQEGVDKLLRKIVWLVYEFGKHCRHSTGLFNVARAIRVTIKIPGEAIERYGGTRDSSNLPFVM